MPCDINDMWNLKYDTNELIYETETDSQIEDRDLWLPKGWRTREEGIESQQIANCYMQDG